MLGFSPINSGHWVITATRLHLLGYLIIAITAVGFESWWPLIYWVGPYVCTKWVYWIQGIQEHLGLTHAPQHVTQYPHQQNKFFHALAQLEHDLSHGTPHLSCGALPCPTPTAPGSSWRLSHRIASEQLLAVPLGSFPVLAARPDRARNRRRCGSGMGDFSSADLNHDSCGRPGTI